MSLDSVALVGLGEALRRLRRAASLQALFRQAPCVLAESIGFERAAVFSLRNRALVAEGVYVRGAPQESERLLERLRSEPLHLGPWLHEGEVLRRRKAMRVEDAVEDARALAVLPDAVSYVVAPVICQEQAVGLIHADRAPLGEAMTESQRDALGAFAEGFGYALECGVLSERLRRHSQHVLALARSTEASVAELASPGIELPPEERRFAPGRAMPAPESDSLETLTRREREVLAMLADGETNARIAQRLVVSEDTVKTHVKHILRKLGVRNRSQAVSRYFRPRSPGAERWLAVPLNGLG